MVMSQRHLQFCGILEEPVILNFTVCTVKLGQSFFYFSLYRPSRPNFLEIEKQIKVIFFNFIFYFPPTHASTVLEFSYVFSFSLFYCCQVD